MTYFILSKLNLRGNRKNFPTFSHQDGFWMPEGADVVGRYPFSVRHFNYI